MKLKSLTLVNFKSFSNSKIDFGDLTMIVGPNGSGKSNIVDALLFLFGSLKGKQLRISRTQDLIRYGENFCIVSGEFEVNGEKITISREVTKSGKNIYRLNGKIVTRNTIIDFLEKHGLHYEGYNFILQGEITKLVKASPKERLEIIKEVAGIKHFEEKIEEAKKNLEKANQDLREIEIVYKEKRNLYEKTKKEFEELKEYYLLKDRLKRLEAGKLLKEKEKISQKVLKLREKLKVILNNLENLKTKKKDLLNELKSLKEEEEKAIEVLKISGERVSLEKEKSELEKRIKELEERIKVLEEEKKNLKLIDISPYYKKLSELKEKYRKEREKEEKLLENLLKTREEIKKIENEIKILREKRERSLQNYIIAKSKLPLIQKLQELKSELNLLEENRKYLKSEKETLENRLSNINKTLERIKEELNTYKGELNILKSLGINPEVVNILKETIDGVYDFAINLCSYDEKYSQAIESAAGRRFFYIVVENEDVAIKCIELLKKLNLGRQTFIPLNVKSKPIGKISGEGIIDYAINLINFPEKFRKVFEYIFGETVIVNSPKYFKKYNFRMATLDGDICEISKVISGGSRERINIKKILEKSNLEKEYQELKKDKEFIEKEILKMSQKIYEIDRKIIEISKEIEVIEKEIPDVDIDILEDEIISIEEKIKELENKKNELLKVQEIKTESQKYENEIQKLENEIKILEEQNLEIEKKISEITSKVITYKEELIALKSKLRNIEDRLKLLPEVDVNYQEIKEKIDKLESQLNEINSEEEKLIEEKIKLEYEISRLENKLNEIKVEEKNPIFVENFDKEIERIQSKISQMKVNLNAEEEFKNAEKQFLEIKGKYEKLLREKEKIIEFIENLKKEKEEKFGKTFQNIRKKFQECFAEIMKGYGDLILKDGIEIVAQPHGKKITNIEALSGGEKTLTALAFILAIAFYKPYPIYIFDEPDQQLDKLNSEKLGQYLEKLSKNSQVICITHRDNIVKYGSKIIGVYMKKGKSEVVSLSLKC